MKTIKNDSDKKVVRVRTSQTRQEHIKRNMKQVISPSDISRLRSRAIAMQSLTNRTGVGGLMKIIEGMNPEPFQVVSENLAAKSLKSMNMIKSLDGGKVLIDGQKNGGSSRS